MAALQRSGIEIRPATEDDDAIVRLELGDDEARLLGLVLVLLAAGSTALFWRWMRRGGDDRRTDVHPRPAGGLVRLVDSPIRVMRWWAAGPRRVGLAMLPVFLHAAAAGLVRLATLGLPLPAGAVIFAALFAAAGLASFALHAGAVVVIYLMAASEPGQARRLVELSALTYWTQAAWSAPAAAVLFSAGAPPGEHPGTVAEVVEVTGRLWGLWLIGLHAAVLRVAAGFTVAGAWAAGVVLCAIFFGFPLLAAALPRIIF